ncbi:hypothetical protein H9P43_006324 [Blastocladiella emersonii ATCC 22665]|nr:hypothetical protein H9P43_006324 [Blastocladiella emersonii ATCC 22665]
MIKPSSGGARTTIHPFLANLVERGMRWPEESSISAIEAFLARLNDRMARTQDREHTPITLRQIAPHIVITIATFANVAVASHLGLPRSSIPPVQVFYNEALAALNDPNSVLGKNFLKDARTLIDNLPRDQIPMMAGREPLVDVPRDNKSGIPLALLAVADE